MLWNRMTVDVGFYGVQKTQNQLQSELLLCLCNGIFFAYVSCKSVQRYV